MGTVYRSPNSTDVNNTELLNLLHEVSNIKHDHLIITGDFNLKEIDWESRSVKGGTESYQRKIFDCINDLFLNETIKSPTRFRGSDTPSKLDWVLSENPELIHDISISPPLGASDHSLISVNYDCITEKDENDVQSLVL